MLTTKMVNCRVKHTAPKQDEDIGQIFDMDYKDSVISLNIYLRDKQDCPFARGNWMIDISLKDSDFYCIKLPSKMKRKDVVKYAQPLIDFLTKKRQIAEKLDG